MHNFIPVGKEDDSPVSDILKYFFKNYDHTFMTVHDKWPADCPYLATFLVKEINFDIVI